MRNRYIEGLNFPHQHPFRQEADRMVLSFDVETFKKDGVIRWISSGRVPPQDVLDFWKYIGKRFNMTKAIAAREREQKAFIKNYNRREQRPTAEQIYEMQANFGRGTIVKNVATGRRTHL